MRGNGIGLLQDTAGADGRLVRVLPEFSTNAGPISLVYPAQKFVPQAVRAFIAIAHSAACVSGMSLSIM